MENKDLKQEEVSGEELLQQYHNQDKDDKHEMGYSVYGVTSSSGDCCC